MLSRDRVEYFWLLGFFLLSRISLEKTCLYDERFFVILILIIEFSFI